MSNNKEFSPARWPVLRQVKNQDVLGLGQSAASSRTESLAARTKGADKVVGSVCPYCAVGCGQLVYVKDKKLLTLKATRHLRFHTAVCAQRERPHSNW
ncbi:MAG: hypothetical protein JO150_05730 [Acidobacteriaceae bacterium]|nr:hypothetical protein [Acidobacteriaceae bacterium]MBV9227563.1 hypothetical protein [Acidobacteriaceae bacterium]MBV9937984.1 hypothetical protein [Acidobacteriaceae bacterium]